MQDGADGGSQRALNARLAQAGTIARAVGKLAREEAMAWDLFRWVVVGLLVINLLLSLILYSGIRSGIASIEQERADYASQLATLSTEVDAKIAGASAGFARDLAAMQSDLTKKLRSPTAPFRRPTPERLQKPQIVAPEMQMVPLPTRSPRR
jgi:hypothetical protein